MNRATIYDYLKTTELDHVSTKVGRSRYPVLRIPFKWDSSFLYINNVRIADFQALILFTNELVVRFMIGGNCQLNIPYRDIHYISIAEAEEIGYQELHEKRRIGQLGHRVD